MDLAQSHDLEVLDYMLNDRALTADVCMTDDELCFGTKVTDPPYTAELQVCLGSG